MSTGKLTSDFRGSRILACVQHTGSAVCHMNIAAAEHACTGQILTAVLLGVRAAQKYHIAKPCPIVYMLGRFASHTLCIPIFASRQDQSRTMEILT